MRGIIIAALVTASKNFSSVIVVVVGGSGVVDGHEVMEVYR